MLCLNYLEKPFLRMYSIIFNMLAASIIILHTTLYCWHFLPTPKTSHLRVSRLIRAPKLNSNRPTLPCPSCKPSSPFSTPEISGFQPNSSFLDSLIISEATIRRPHRPQRLALNMQEQVHDMNSTNKTEGISDFGVPGLGSRGAEVGWVLFSILTTLNPNRIRNDNRPGESSHTCVSPSCITGSATICGCVEFGFDVLGQGQILATEFLTTVPS